MGIRRYVQGKTKSKTVRFTEEELKSLNDASKKLQMNSSEFIRNAALGVARMEVQRYQDVVMNVKK